MNQKKIIYTDILRIIGTLAVIMLHVTGGKWGSIDINSSEWIINNFYNGITRWSVPVFVMVSGFFMLNPNKEIGIKEIFTKNIWRIVKAFCFWSLFYAIISNRLSAGTWGKMSIWAVGKSFVIGHYHLWFLYMIVGLYIITPILRVFVKAASQDLLKYFLVLAFIFNMILPIIVKLEWINSLPIILNKLSLNLVLGYTFYYVAGYYFGNFDIEKKTRGILYALGLLSLIATPIRTMLLSYQMRVASDIFLSNYSPFVAISALAIFVWAKNIFKDSEKIKKSHRLIHILAKASFTIYLVQEIFLIIFKQIGITTSMINPLIGIPLMTAVIFVGAYMIYAVAGIFRKSSNHSLSK